VVESSRRVDAARCAATELVALGARDTAEEVRKAGFVLRVQLEQLVRVAVSTAHAAAGIARCSSFAWLRIGAARYGFSDGRVPLVTCPVCSGRGPRARIDKPGPIILFAHRDCRCLAACRKERAITRMLEERGFALGTLAREGRRV